MALDLEGLINSLLVVICSSGQQGCSIFDFLQGARHVVDVQMQDLLKQNDEDDNVPHGEADKSREIFRSTASTLWKWTVSRQDVSVGPERIYNDLTLDEVLAKFSVDVLFEAQQRPEDEGVVEDETPELNTYGGPGDLRLFVSEDTMWHALAGHGKDLKRIPRLEWLLLVGIASSKWRGIIQATLRRLVDQDKRSVPKRTDSLLAKGYISKRLTIAKGAKTSQLWLKSFAPVRAGEALEAAAGMNLTTQVLAASREPVPWHERWTLQTIDYHALTMTIVATVKEWGVIRIWDLKLKLNISKKAWQQRVFAKLCRALVAMGVIEYVAALQDAKMYKDCIRFVRDLKSEDWSRIAANNKKTGPKRTITQEDEEGNVEEPEPASKYLSSLPPWSPERPFAGTINNYIRFSGSTGLGNHDFFALTAGPSFRRYITNVTATMAIPGLQPASVKRFQLRCLKVRYGKIGAFRYFQEDAVPAQEETDQATKKGGKKGGTSKKNTSINARAQADVKPTGPYGFPPPTALPNATKETTTLEALCGGFKVKKKVIKQKAPQGEAGPIQNGEPIVVDSLETRKPETQPDARIEDTAIQGPAQSNGATAIEADIAEELQSTPPRPIERPVLRSGRTRGATRKASTIETTTPSGDLPRNSSKVTAQESGMVETAAGPTTVEQPSAGAVKSPIREPTGPLHEDQEAHGVESQPLEEIKTTEQPLPESRNEQLGASEDHINTVVAPTSAAPVRPAARRGRGRPKGSGRGSARGRSRGRVLGPVLAPVRGRPANGEEGSVAPIAKPHVCEKCGGSWKNDNGLQYHLEKSKTTCNPNYEAIEKQVEEPLAPLLKRRARARTAVPEAKSSSESSDSDVPKKRQDMKRRRARAVRSPSLSESELWLPGYQAASTSWRRSVEREGTGIAPNQQNVLIIDGTSQVQDAEVIKEHIQEVAAQQPRTVILDTPGNLDVAKTAKPDSHPANGLWQNHALARTTETDEQQLSASQEDNELSAIRFALAMAKRIDIITNLIKAFLKYNGGVIMGGDFLRQKIIDLWAEYLPEDGPPRVADCCRAITRLRRKEEIKEHWHGFMGLNNSFHKLQIIMWPEMDPFSPFVTHMREEAWASMSREGDPKSKKPNRGRALGEAVVRLEAPVYREENAARRDAEYLQDYIMSRTVQRRDRGASSSSDDSFVDGWKWINEHAVDDENPNPAQAPGPAHFHILQPNTFLYDDPEGPVRKRLPMTAAGEEFARSKYEAKHRPDHHAFAFVPMLTIETSNAEWPRFQVSDFERGDASFTTKGWMPSVQSFELATLEEKIEHEIEKRKKYNPVKMAGMRRHRRRHVEFMQRLMVCAEIEISTAERCDTPEELAAGPHVNFINFFRGPLDGRVSHGERPDEDVNVIPDWRLKNQLTLASADDLMDQARHWAAIPEEAYEQQPYRAIIPRYQALRAHRANRVFSPLPQSTLPQSRQKRVLLVSRNLSDIPRLPEPMDAAVAVAEQSETLLSAFIAVRVLLGGQSSIIDWGLLMKLYPEIGLRGLRKFWVSVRRKRLPYIAKLTKRFQDGFLVAYDRGELDKLDYEDPEAYDWPRLFEWMEQLIDDSLIGIPGTAEALDRNFTLSEAPKIYTEDWREKFAHQQSSVFARFEAVTQEPAAITLGRPLTSRDKTFYGVVARSWVKSVCGTSTIKYTVQNIQERFKALTKAWGPGAETLIEDAVTQLVKDKIATRSPRENHLHPWRLNDVYAANLLRHADKYTEAAAFKTTLDTVFRRGETLRIPYVLDDGAVLALMNLAAKDRIRIVSVDVPHIPDGFEPGNYETRKYSKSYYHFNLEAVPTERYLYDEDIDVLRAAERMLPRLEGRDKLLMPQWVDFFGVVNRQKWSHILGIFLFALTMRGAGNTEQTAVDALHPLLEGFEARVIMEWGRETGVLQGLEGLPGVEAAEWWWLVVSRVATGLQP